MKTIHATKKHLHEVTSWIATEPECRMWGGPLVSYPIYLQRLIEEIEFTANNSFVMIDKDKVVGFGQVIDTTDNRNHLSRVITNPEYRGKGYGLELCKSLVAIAQEGQSVTTLNVYRNNEAAVTLYQKLGFNEDFGKSTADNVFMVMVKTVVPIRDA